jgi:dCTP diphosphatase
MNDNKTTLQDLKKLLSKFRDDRDWSKFHDPKNLAEAISVEAAELQELFLWQDVKEVIKKIKEDASFRKEVEEEFADIMIFAINFANSIGIDIAKVIEEKVDKNNKKYPVEKAKGRADKYNKL